LIKVKGVAIVTKHVKARRQGEVSAIKKQEGYIHISNVMFISPIDNQPCRVNFKTLEDGKKVRVCNRTQQIV
jgi:large subunit ribosomal protein L24